MHSRKPLEWLADLSTMIREVSAAGFGDLELQSASLTSAELTPFVGAAAADSALGCPPADAA